MCTGVRLRDIMYICTEIVCESMSFIKHFLQRHILGLFVCVYANVTVMVVCNRTGNEDKDGASKSKRKKRRQIVI